MADALKTFKEGEDILASETNENNQFLLSKLSDNAAQVQSYVEGEVASIKSNVASVQATLQNNIDEVANSRSIYIKECSGDGKQGYIVYNNGLCEQWGRQETHGRGVYTVPFLKQYKDNNTNVYTQTIYGNLDDYNNAINIGTITTSTFVMYQGFAGGTAYIQWRSIGYVTV